ncbi:nuclear transport factor 2 family protein [Streptomyces sp. BV286]|uniref:nuclear transport factor 2 family protein n=1 Tax=Streptomyces sp. BV286 TaxID=2849672 RepID=UPI001C2EA478|nr:nuclear transport factor 2 family protein [Streptomyces sp. BV286]MBV1940447.1 nuclear transport factor 2 family protein [Streptomyces sp. BV286]
MSATETRNVVLGFFKALSAGDLEAASDLLDEEFVWWVSGKPEYLPIAGTYNKAQVVALSSKVGAAMPDGIQMTITGSTVEGDRAAVEAEVYGVSPTGKVYDNRNFFAVEVRDGRIRAVREYFDTIHTNEVLFNNVYADDVLREA